MSDTWISVVSKNNGTHVPVPQVNIERFSTNPFINFNVTYNEADRWILGYEPEIYLYIKKKRSGGRNHGQVNPWTKHQLNRFAHTPNWDGSSITSLKKDVNKRLNAKPLGRPKATTEWQVVGTTPDMFTQIQWTPWELLGSVATNWNGSWLNSAGTFTWFPIGIDRWNSTGSWTEYPATFTSMPLSKQHRWLYRQVQSIVFWFKTVIRNPNWGHPIESDISEIMVLHPSSNNSSWQFDRWQVSYNYSTR